MTQHSPTTTAKAGEFISERAVRRAFDGRSRPRRGTVGGARRRATGATTVNGARLLRRWSVAELIAGATVRPSRPVAL